MKISMSLFRTGNKNLIQHIVNYTVNINTENKASNPVNARRIMLENKSSIGYDTNVASGAFILQYSDNGVDWHDYEMIESNFENIISADWNSKIENKYLYWSWTSTNTYFKADTKYAHSYWRLYIRYQRSQYTQRWLGAYKITEIYKQEEINETI